MLSGNRNDEAAWIVFFVGCDFASSRAAGFGDAVIDEGIIALRDSGLRRHSDFYIGVFIKEHAFAGTAIAEG